MVQAILDAGGSDLEARRDDGYTAFLVACCHGHVDCVEALSQAGCEKEARANNGRTRLIAAATNGHLAVVQAVLDVGRSDIDDKDNRVAEWSDLEARENGHVGATRRRWPMRASQGSWLPRKMDTWRYCKGRTRW